MKDFSTGKTASRSITVLPQHLASSVGSGSLDVLATPAVIALMEGAAADLAQSLLDEPFTTVGTKLQIEHTAPTPPGAVVTATATLTEVSGRLFCFSVSACDSAGEVARGSHERVSVKKDSFPQKARDRIQNP